MRYEVGDRTACNPPYVWVACYCNMNLVGWLSIDGNIYDNNIAEGLNTTYFNTVRWAISVLKARAKVRKVGMNSDALGPFHIFEDL